MTLVVGRRELPRTPLLEAPATPSSVRPVRWRSPARDLWIGTVDGSYIGMVERVGSSYIASDGLAGRVGEFGSLPEAERSLAVDADTRRSRSAIEPHSAMIVAIVSGVAAIATAVAGIGTLTL